MTNSDMTIHDRHHCPVTATPTAVDRDDRAADLLARMTIDEKLGQLGSAWVFQIAGRDGFDPDRADPLLATRHRAHHADQRREQL